MILGTLGHRTALGRAVDRYASAALFAFSKLACGEARHRLLDRAVAADEAARQVPHLDAFLAAEGGEALAVRVLREAGVPLAGFLTEELREGGRRVGFAIETFDGTRGVRIASISGRDEQRLVRFSFERERRARIVRDA